MQQDEFRALIDRLENAADLLRSGGALLQAIARRYYLVYTFAVQAAEKHGVTFRRGVDTDLGRAVSHNVLPDLVRALYVGQNSGPVLGGGPGVTRSGRLDHNAAFRYTVLLQRDRKAADYGYVQVREPYDILTADERLRWANHLVEDLRSLL